MQNYISGRKVQHKIIKATEESQGENTLRNRFKEHKFLTFSETEV